MTNLPKTVVKRDHDLSQSYESIGMELMEHRWHWTLDESNAKRVSIKEYAESVGRTQTTIKADAEGWVAYLAQQESIAAGEKVVERAPNAHRKLAKMSATRQHATKALADATGQSVQNVVRHRSEELKTVLRVAKYNADANATNVEDEIDKVVKIHAGSQKAAAEKQTRKKAKHAGRWLEINADLGYVMTRLRKVLNTAEGVPFTDDEIELVTASLGKVRALIGLIDLRISGETDIDWDAEFQKLTVG